MPSILIINPNSSISITQGLMDILEPSADFTYKFFTGPSLSNSSDPNALRITENGYRHSEPASSCSCVYCQNSILSLKPSHSKSYSFSNTLLSVPTTPTTTATPPNKTLSSPTYQNIVPITATPQSTLSSATKPKPVQIVNNYAPPQIDSLTTQMASAAACLPLLIPMIKQHDAFLVACFSDHPLIGILREQVPYYKPVMGIFQASCLFAMGLQTKFSIVTTAKVWEALLDQGVATFLGGSIGSSIYAGTFSTGLGVLELHQLPKQKVKERLVQCALKAVNEHGATSIILGCAGLSGLEEAIREAVKGKNIAVIDSVVAGTQLLEGLVRSRTSLYGEDVEFM